MARKPVPPEYGRQDFTCPQCGVHSTQIWMYPNNLDYLLQMMMQDPKDRGVPFDVRIRDAAISVCLKCHHSAFWAVFRVPELKGEEYVDKDFHRLVYPRKSLAPEPSEDMPEDIRKDFIEASYIVRSSPRGAAALLRLCIQKLMPHLGKKGKELNNDIGALVEEKVLSPKIERALDSVRVIGNESVHAGELDLRDNEEIAYLLFDLVNLIIDQTLTAEKKVNLVFDSLPENKLEAIAKRDST